MNDDIVESGAHLFGDDCGYFGRISDFERGLHEHRQCSSTAGAARLLAMQELVGLAILLLIALGVLVALVVAMLVYGATHPPRHTAGYAVANGMACDPAELQLPFESWTLDRPDGVRLPVWEVTTKKARRHEGTEARREEGNLTAVFCHGWGQSRIDMLGGIELWLDLCDRIVLYDLRGHGEATGGPSRLGCNEDDDLIALLERLGQERLVLVGRSMGAVIALAAAARQASARDRILGVVAYAPYTYFHMTLRRRLRRDGVPARPITDLAVLLWRLRGLRQRNTSDDAQHLRCPLLVIHGSHDPITPVSQGRQIAAEAPDAQFHLVEGADHSHAELTEGESHDELVRAFVGGIVRTADDE